MASTIWRGQLTFGLVSFPVRLYTAARKKRVQMHYLRRAEAEPQAPATAEEEPYSETDAPVVMPPRSSGAAPAPMLVPEAPPPATTIVSRVHQALAASTDERPVAREELVKGIEVAPQQFVTFRNEELRSLRATTSPDMQVIRSVHLAEIDPVFFETSYYVVPSEGGDRPYSLLFAALQQTGYVAIAKLAMHGREHVMVVRPGAKSLIAHTMFYTGEIRKENEFEAATDIAAKELDLAKKFVEAIAGPFAPEEFKDEYRQQVENLVSGKLERRELAASAPASKPAAAPVVDLLEALKKSLDMARKPAQTEQHKASKVTEIKPRAKKR